MNEQEKREAIREVVGPLIRWAILRRYEADEDDINETIDIVADALEGAILVPVEVEHILPQVDPVGCPNGYTIADGIYNLPYPEEGVPIEEFRYEAEGLYGKPGEAWAIIVPRRKEKQDETHTYLPTLEASQE